MAAQTPFLVNTYTNGSQFRPTVAMDGDGDFVIVWQHSPVPGTPRIFARLFGPTGTPRAAPFQVNEFTVYGQQYPAVAMEDSGDFIVVWDGEDVDEEQRIAARRYNSSGVAQGPELAVQVAIGGSMGNPAVASDPDGDVAVVWRDHSRDGNLSGVFARTFDSAGVALSGDVLVNEVTAGNQTNPRVAMLSSGGFVVVWQGPAGIYQRRFDASGAPAGGATSVNTDPGAGKNSPSVAEHDDTYVVVWVSPGQSGSVSGIYGQRFSTSGTFAGGEFRVSAFTLTNAVRPTVALQASGEFVVAWTESPGAGATIYGRRFTSTGTAVGSDFFVSAANGADDADAAAAAHFPSFVVGWTQSAAPPASQDVYARLFDSRRPVLLIPGIGGTYAADVTNDLPWLIHRGVAPAMLQIDPLSRAYHDIIKTLENVGYVNNKDLFVVNYDWRLPPGPDDGTIDGTIDGLTAAGISDQVYLYAVDYLGEALRKAAEQWEIDHPGSPLDAVDVIVHSTGGLIARTYLQSDAYGAVYTGSKELPEIADLIMIGVPNRGAAKAWNPLHDNWVVDPAFQMVLSKIINRAYQKVLAGAVISGPDYNISGATIGPPGCTDGFQICFIKQYVPTARALLATYDFIDFGSGLTHVNGDPAQRNSLILDLNAGLDLAVVGDSNAFADLTDVTVIYGTNGGTPLAPLPGLPAGTPTSTQQKAGPAGGSFGFLSIARFVDFLSRDAGPDEEWFDDILAPVSGDGTVPIDSSAGQFAGDARIDLEAFTKGGNTQESVGHTDLMFNTDVQQKVLDTLGVSCAAPCAQISTTLNGVQPSAINCAVTGCSSFILDPAEGFLVDGLGRRLGWSETTGAVTEIPESVWFGNSNGMGWVFGPVVEPLTLELTGLGESYYAAISVLGPAGQGGIVDQGDLGMGDERSLPVPVSRIGSLPILDFDADGAVEPVTDGLLALRYLFDFSGPGLTANAVAEGCLMCDGDSIAAYAAARGLVLDIDGNGDLDPLTDGLLFLRYLFDFTGGGLTGGAVADDCTRCDADAIVPYLDGLD